MTHYLCHPRKSTAPLWSVLLITNTCIQHIILVLHLSPAYRLQTSMPTNAPWGPPNPPPAYPEKFLEKKTDQHVNGTLYDWYYHDTGHPTNSGWQRIRRLNGTATETHFGISPTSQESSIDSTFVCTFQLRNPKVPRLDVAKLEIGIILSRITQLARRHRDSGEDYCSCGFKDLVDRKGCGREWDLTRGFLKWLDAHMLRNLVRKHDRLCSCGCFKT